MTQTTTVTRLADEAELADDASTPEAVAHGLDRLAMARRALAAAEGRTGVRSRDERQFDRSQHLVEARRPPLLQPVRRTSSSERVAERGSAQAVSEPSRLFPDGGSPPQGGLVVGMGELLEGLPPVARLPGSVVAVAGATSAFFAVAAAGWGRTAWGVIAAMPDAGLVAAAELGVPLERTVCVPHLGANPSRAAGVLVDGFEVVLLGSARFTARQQRQLTARARQRGTRLLVPAPWQGADVVIEIDAVAWRGIGRGHGVLSEPRLRVQWQLARAAGRTGVASSEVAPVAVVSSTAS